MAYSVGLLRRGRLAECVARIARYARSDANSSGTLRKKCSYSFVSPWLSNEARVLRIMGVDLQPFDGWVEGRGRIYGRFPTNHPFRDPDRDRRQSRHTLLRRIRDCLRIIHPTVFVSGYNRVFLKRQVPNGKHRVADYAGCTGSGHPSGPSWSMKDAMRGAA